MPPKAADVAAILILVLPGFLAYRFAVARRADPSEQTPLWQLTEILEYSLYVHLLGAGLTLAVHYALAAFSVETHLNELLSLDPSQFVATYPGTGIPFFIGYPVYVLIGATFMGAYDIPRAVGNGLMRAFARVRPPPPEYRREPIWYLALHEMRLGLQANRVLLLVKMKSGDIYYGELASYPIEPDHRKEKDFLVTKARFYPKGNLSDEYRLDDVDGEGAVLLNSDNVDSIQVFYDKPQEPAPTTPTLPTATP